MKKNIYQVPQINIVQVVSSNCIMGQSQTTATEDVIKGDPGVPGFGSGAARRLYI